MKKQAVLSLSGGMDSSTVLLRLLADGYEVTALSFDYGQKHRVELERAQALVNYINKERLSPTPKGAIEAYPEVVKYGTIKLDGLAPMLNSALVEGGDEVPEGHYEQENMKETVVPNRNKIFSSLIQAVALSIANEKNTEVHIAMGIHAGDHAIYPDCRQEFRDADYTAFTEGNWDAERVSYVTPYLNGDKYDILVDGAKCSAMNWGYNLEAFMRTQILVTSPLILMVLGTVTINQLHRWKGLKLFLNWENQIAYSMLMNQDLSRGMLYRSMLKTF